MCTVPDTKPHNWGMKRMHCQLSVLLAKKNLELAQDGGQVSQRSLAKQLGLSPTTVNKLYNGRPLTGRIDPETVEKICDYFQCGIDELFTLKEEGV
jgi:putative transcriptional regulator